MQSWKPQPYAKQIHLPAVVCKASSPVEAIKKIVAAAAALPAMIVAHPAYALVRTHSIAVNSCARWTLWRKGSLGHAKICSADSATTGMISRAG